MSDALDSAPFPSMIELEQAWSLLAEAVADVAGDGETQSLPLEAALGRVLADAVLARCDQPPFDQSAMDGIALAAALKQPGQTLVCPVDGVVAAGDLPDAVMPRAGSCVRIMTGAPLPRNCDAVVMVEQVRFEAGDPERVVLVEDVAVGAHVRRRGENMQVGAVAAPAGARITAPMLGALLAQGVRRVCVRRPLRVGFATTGDEVVDYRRALQPGQIYNSNALAVAAALGDQGGAMELQQLGVLPDDLAATETCLARCHDLDLVIVTGGVSMGRFDHVPQAARQAGYAPVFHKIRMKPGKPVWFGKHPKGALLLGLPGNPVSALVGTWLFAHPLVRALQGSPFCPPPMVHAPLDDEVRNRGRLPLFVPALLHSRAAGMSVSPLVTSGSGDAARFSFCQALLRVAPGAALKKGELVQVLLPFNP